MSVPDEGLIQKIVVRTLLDIYVFIYFYFTPGQFQNQIEKPREKDNWKIM